MKRIIASFLAFLIVFSLCPMNVVFADAIETGNCGTNLKWYLLSDGTLNITGTGPMNSFKNSCSAPWYYNASLIKRIEISSGVTSVGNYAFYACSRATEITIPDSVTHLGDYSFAYSSIKSIKLPEKVGKNAFYGSALQEIILPVNMENFNFSTFEGCFELTSINVAEENAFFSSEDGVLFDKNKSKLICYPMGRTDDYTIPNTVTTIGTSAFEGSNITHVSIPNSVTTIESSAFESCELKSISIPDSVTQIADAAFYNCYSLYSVSLPNKLEVLSERLFYNCVNLSSVRIPKSINEIGSYTFYECSCLSDIYYTGTKAEWDETIGVQTWNQVIHYNCSDDWEAPKPWCIDENGLLTINMTGAMRDFNSPYLSTQNLPWSTERSNIKRVIINEGVTSIGTHAFHECVNLEEAKIPDSVTKINLCAFSHCSNMTSISFSANVTSIDDNAFYNCNNLSDVYFGGTEKEWSKISIGANNEWLSNASIHYQKRCTITYNYTANGGTSASKVSDIVTTGNTLDLSTITAAKSGWEFVGWNTNPNATEALSSYNVTNDVTLYALFKKTLTGNFYYGNNILQTTKTVTIYNNATSGSITAPNLSLYSGWDAIGWRNDTSASTKEYDNTESISISSDTDFYGIYSRILTLYYNANGGSNTPPNQTATQYYNAYGNKENKSFTLDSTISRTGYAFDKWAKGSTGGNTYSAGSNISVSDDTTMYATWIKLLPSENPVITVSNIVGGKAVAISCAINDATIYYTLDGTTPTVNSAIYSSQIYLKNEGTYTIKAIAIKEGYEDSSIITKQIIVGNTYVVQNGTCGENAIWVLESDGTLTISGSGEMENYRESFYTPWYENLEKIITVNIENGITSIGNYSFDFCQNLTSATISDTVTHIGTEAFASTGLTNIIIPNSVESIGDWAFSGSELTNLVIPESVTSIGAYAFNCTPLKSVTVPSTVKSLGRGVFNYSGISDAIIGCDLPMDAFWKCSGLENVTLLDGVTTIGVQAFMECEDLKSVTIPSSVTHIQEGAFTWIPKLTDIYYTGSEEQWNTITIDSYNYLSDVTKHFGEKSGYIIKYDYSTNGGNTVVKNMDVVGDGTSVDLTVEATKDGWDFVGWNIAPEAEEALSDYTATGDVTLYAIFKRDITAYFYSQENTLQKSQTTTIYNNASMGVVTAPEPLPYYEWTGIGWRDDTAALAKEYAVSKKIYVTNDIHLYGIYSRNLTLSYDANGGDTTPPDQIELQYYNAYGNKQIKHFTLASAISKGSDTFYKWAKDSVAGVAYDAEADIAITDDATMYATWVTKPSVAEPIISVSDIEGGKCVSISCSTTDATIHYTTDGTTPTTDSSIYTSSLDFTMAGITEIRAIAVKNGYTSSSVSIRAVVVEKATTPTPSILSGIITESINVELTCDTDGATIYYTIDGTIPTKDSEKYESEITICETKTLKAIAIAQGYVDSDCMVCTYTYQEPVVGVPTVTTGDATEITKNTATLSAVIEDDGGSSVISSQFVYWNKYNSLVKYTITADSNFNATLKNLSPNSTYYYYAKATNENGTGTGLIKSFNTTSEDSPQSISVFPTYLSIKIDETYQLLATVLPVSASNRNVVWSTSDKNIVTVDNDGKIKGIKRGTAVITATTEVGRLKAACTVDVGGGNIDGTFDFSEWNMASNTSYFAKDGFDWDTTNDGGNSIIATAYLARWDGAVLESNDEYPSYNGYPQELYYEKDSDYHVQEVLWLPDRKNALDNDEIKNAILKYGAVSASYLSNTYYYNNNYSNYYHPADAYDSGGGHAIAIVGWDDDYSATNFKITPPGNGAFICKNSWGSYYGDNGYFYISYYDKHIGVRGTTAVLTSLERNTNYNTIYQYDPLGAVGYYGYMNSTYAANVFPQNGTTLNSNELLQAVSFYTYYKNTSYEVYVIKNYKNKSSLSQMGRVVASGTLQDIGYHTITLDNSISLAAGTRFAVIVKLSVPGEYSYVYFEYPLEDYSSNARANTDESYISGNGAMWTDFTNVYTNSNLCIKAFTNNNRNIDSDALFAAIDNDNRAYESNTVYTMEDALESGIKINEEYVEYINKKKNSVDLFSENTEVSLGDIPNIIDIGSNTVSFVDGAILPSKYDLREENSVTVIRNQGSWGTCWAHAVYASLESALLKKSKTINATSQGDALSDDYIADINQTGIPPVGLALSEEAIIMAVGSEYRLYADITPDNATERDVIWSSDNENVAIVDTNGQIVALEPGNATIRCTTLNGDYTAQCVVQVEDGETVNNITLEYESITKSIGDIFMIDYTINPSTAANQEVLWSSDNPDVVAVNQNGLMTSLSVGTAKITIQTKDGGKTDTVTVQVNDGLECEIMDLTTNFSKYDKHLFGSVNVSIDNRTDTDKLSSVIIAIYNTSGQMLMIKQMEKTLSSGENTIMFNNLFIENLADSDCKIKCLVWNSFSSVKPLSAYIEKKID